MLLIYSRIGAYSCETNFYKKTLSNSEIFFTEIPKKRLTNPPTLANSYGLIYQYHSFHSYTNHDSAKNDLLA